MIAGYVLIQTEVGAAATVAGTLQDLPGVSAATSVLGPYDVILRTEARTIDQMGRLVVSRIQTVAGVLRTTTCPIISRAEAARRGS